MLIDESDVLDMLGKIDKLPLKFLVGAHSAIVTQPSCRHIEEAINSGKPVILRDATDTFHIQINDYVELAAFARAVETTVDNIKRTSLFNAEKNAHEIVVEAPKSILHVTAGISGEWEPTQAEFDELTKMFSECEADPNGGVVVTRQGVSAVRHFSE